MTFGNGFPVIVAVDMGTHSVNGRYWPIRLARQQSIQSTRRRPALSYFGPRRCCASAMSVNEEGNSLVPITASCTSNVVLVCGQSTPFRSTDAGVPQDIGRFEIRHIEAPVLCSRPTSIDRPCLQKPLRQALTLREADTPPSLLPSLGTPTHRRAPHTHTHTTHC